MPRAKNGIGRRYKKRRTSPASAIEVEQIEEEGVEELVVVEGATEEVAEIAIVDFGEDVVMWVLDHLFEKVWAERDWQAYQFVRCATMSSVVVREWKRGGGSGGSRSPLVGSQKNVGRVQAGGRGEGVHCMRPIRPMGALAVQRLLGDCLGLRRVSFFLSRWSFFSYNCR